MKDQKKSKLAQYSALAGAVLGTGSVMGQVNYVDIQDTTLQSDGDYYDVDLDQDGSPDFKLTQYLDAGASGLFDAIMVTPYDSLYSRVSGEIHNGFSYPFKLIPGDSIQSSSKWGGNTATQSGYLVFQFDGTPYPNSFWKGPVDNGYLGVKIIQSDGFHYGWIRLSVSADNRSFTVKDFAFQTTVNESILAGEPNLSVLEEMLNNLHIGQNNGQLYFSKPSTYGDVAVRILNISGQEIDSLQWESEEVQYNLSQLPAGVILIEFEYNGIRNTRKVLNAQ